MGALIAKNKKLYILRNEAGLSQIECAYKLGIPTNQYAAIEQGKTRGKVNVWSNIQKLFNVPDADMWDLIKGSM